MKKVIVTRENYEEVMFDLLENTYPQDVRENILDQIHADTFLNFEWQQWSKATYSESTELYKTQEAEFIENLTREEEKKKGILYYWLPMAVAATILLFIGLYMTNDTTKTTGGGIVRTEERRAPEQKTEQAKRETGSVEESSNPLNKAEAKQEPGIARENIAQVLIPTLPLIKDTLLAVQEQKPTMQPVPSFQDTIKSMIAAASRPSRYKVSIQHGVADAIEQESQVSYVEKRYSMADVMNRKDGISLSKFLQNPNSRIVTDKSGNKVAIEYIAEDHSILVLTLSN